MNSYFEHEVSLPKKLFLCVLFALAYAQSPLFSSNQNTYFLHGLADSNHGFLGMDWMANSADPFPLFSCFVEKSSTYFPDFFFHFYYLVVLGIFMYAALGIATEVWGWTQQRSLLTYFLVITGLFSLLFSFASSNIFGVNLSHLFQNGLANQYVLGSVLQPSTFGVFLLLSVYLFLKDKRFLSILALAVAVNVHATYLLSAAFLTLAYMLSLLKKKNRKEALFVGLLSLILVLPNLLYTYFTFTSQPQESVLAAQKILVDFRIPHHTKPGDWFGFASAFQISLMLFALFLIRKKKEIFLILAVPFSLAVLLSAIQIVSQSYFLALLFPWRVSVLLMPLSVFILGGKLVEELEDRNVFRLLSERALKILSISTLLFLVITGISSFFLQYKSDTKRPSYAMEEVVKSTKKPSSIYLIPPRLERFRLRTEAPIFVDKKTHPYKSDEVEEWYRRLILAERFYVEADCTVLDAMMSDNTLTHVVDTRSLTCAFLTQVYSDKYFKIFERKSEALN